MAAPKLEQVGGAAATGTVAVEEVTSRRPRRRRSADSDGATADEQPKPEQEYECRFCFTKFKKSQALGGHMNRHRQEREKEQYHHAQQLVSSMAQQQMPRSWTSLAAAAAATEMTQSPSAPGGALSCLSSHLTGGATQQQFPGPPFSFASYRGPAPTSASNPSVQSSPSSNYYLSSNSSSCNNVQNLHWAMEGGGLSTAGTPRSAPPTGTFQADPTTSTSLPFPPEAFASIFRAPVTNNDTSMVSSGTATGTPPGPYDLYQPFPNSFLGGM